ncbi:antibiotic biosynthesis monooxygenase [Rhodobacterales bacterium HKCCE2091]|nr:antibiotic biosynthesis monooxygenase [Rhodobacterales bacterium HKCCE2091]
MTFVLEGRLICASDEEARIVEEHLPEHIRLTRAEDGCISFDVRPGEAERTWEVRERFADQESFEAHQERTRNSAWGRATAGIDRDYAVRVEEE